ncbi:hypothetical protein ACFL6I_29145, partial [candidate division KSB1 bacterium]
GSQRIVFNRIILNSSIQLGFSFNGWRGQLQEPINFESNQDNYFEHITESRIFSHYMININLGIGLLVF